MIGAERFLKEQGLQPRRPILGALPFLQRIQNARTFRGGTVERNLTVPVCSLEAQMRRKRHDTRDTLGVSGTAILLPQRIQMILTHAGKPHCDCWTLRLDLPAHCVSA